MKKDLKNKDVVFVDVCCENDDAVEIAKHFSSGYIKCNWRQFNDGEMELVDFPYDLIKNKNIVVYQSIHYPYDILFKILILIRNLKRNNPLQINLISPYVGYIRPHDQLVAEGIFDTLFAFGVDKLITLDPHSLELFTDEKYKEKIVVLDFKTIFIEIIEKLIKEKNIDRMCFVSPDAGARMKNETCAGYFNCSCYCAEKKRGEGDVKVCLNDTIKENNIFIIDDIVDTGRTLELTVEEILKQKRNAIIYIICTHGMLSSFPRVLKINNVHSLITTSSLPQRFLHKKLFIYKIMQNNFLINNIWQIINPVKRNIESHSEGM